MNEQTRGTAGKDRLSRAFYPGRAFPANRPGPQSKQCIRKSGSVRIRKVLRAQKRIPPKKPVRAGRRGRRNAPRPSEEAARPAPWSFRHRKAAFPHQGRSRLPGFSGECTHPSRRTETRREFKAFCTVQGHQRNRVGGICSSPAPDDIALPPEQKILQKRNHFLM